MKTFQIALIGAGNIGSRHLQGLAKITMPVEIHVFDLNKDSLNTSKLRFEEVKGNKNNFINKISYIENMDLIPEKLDVCIIATNSSVRRKVLEELLLRTSINFLVLEKFLFQKVRDYIEVDQLLKEKNIQAWVNCSRRMWPIYNNLAEKFLDAENINFTVSASHLGIGCNGIHFIDLFEYLTNKRINIIRTENLKIVESKRNNYIDFTGTIIGQTTNLDKITINSYGEENAPLLIQINSNKIRVMINELEGYVQISEKCNSWKWEKIDFSYPYQSNLTNLLVEDLLDKSNCDLPEYVVSSRMHLTILEPLIYHLETIYDKEVNVCPIT